VTVSNVDYVEVFRDQTGAWCWHAVAGNREIVAMGKPQAQPDVRLMLRANSVTR
jgi:hypothetical protein